MALHESNPTNMVVDESKIGRKGIVLDQVKSIIQLPEFRSPVQQPEDIVVPHEARIQLVKYIVALAKMYKNNPFHNFAHASNVALSTQKLLSRIVANRWVGSMSGNK